MFFETLIFAPQTNKKDNLISVIIANIQLYHALQMLMSLHFTILMVSSNKLPYMFID